MLNRNERPHVEDARIDEPVILVRIARTYHDNINAHDLYEATRGVWTLGPRRNTVRYVLAVYRGIVREVYQVHRWDPALTNPYKPRVVTREEARGKWEFQGVVAPREVRDRYINKSVQHYFSHHGQNPIKYVP